MEIASTVVNDIEKLNHSDQLDGKLTVLFSGLLRKCITFNTKTEFCITWGADFTPILPPPPSEIDKFDKHFCERPTMTNKISNLHGENNTVIRVTALLRF